MMKSCSSRCRTSSLFALAAAALALYASGCSDAASSGPSGYGTPASGNPPGNQVAAECEDKLQCETSGPAEDGLTPICMQTVDTTIMSMSGQPVPEFMVTTCGRNLCTKGKSDASGNVHIAICQAMRGPGIEVDGGPRYVSFAVPLSQPIAVVSPLTLVPLPAAGGDLTAAAQSGTAVSSDAAVLSPAPGTTVEFDIKDAFDTDSQKFRAAFVPVDKASPFLEPSLGIELLVGLAPARARLSAPAGLSVPNTPGWPAGTAVRFHQLGVDPLGEGPAPFGGWSVLATGRVSDDGNSITTDPGAGIAYLALMGIERI